MKKINPRLIVIVGVIFISFSSIFVKISGAPALVISTYRLGFTALFLLPSVIMHKRSELKNVSRRDLILCILSGIFLAFHFATWITSIKYTSIASSTVLVNTHPIFIIIMSYTILKEKVTKKAILSMFITLAGGFIVSSGDSSLGSNILYGDVLAMLGALFVAGYMMIGRVARQRLSVTVYTFIVYLSCTITLFILDFITSTPLYPYSFKEIIIFLCLAVFCTILGHSIFNWALEFVRPAFISIAVLGEPVFATVWASLLFRELPRLWNVAGGVIIILGIYLFIKSDI